MGARDQTDDRGQAAIMFVIVVVALATLAMAGLAQLGGAARDRVRAQSAADAAALASARRRPRRGRADRRGERCDGRVVVRRAR